MSVPEEKIPFMREVWKELVLPNLEMYFNKLLEHREKENSWPPNAIFWDLVKPFEVDGQRGKDGNLELICLVPPTQAFWSAIISMYILWAPETFPTHSKACMIFLDCMQDTKFIIKNLCEYPFLVEYLLDSWEGKRENLFLESPVYCAAEIVNNFMIAQEAKNKDGKKKTEADLGKPDEELIDMMDKKYSDVFSKWFGHDDGQGKTDD